MWLRNRGDDSANGSGFIASGNDDGDRVSDLRGQNQLSTEGVQAIRRVLGA